MIRKNYKEIKKFTLLVKEPLLIKKIFLSAKKQGFETNLPFYTRSCLCKYFHLPEKVICNTFSKKQKQAGKKKDQGNDKKSI